MLVSARVAVFSSNARQIRGVKWLVKSTDRYVAHHQFTAHVMKITRVGYSSAAIGPLVALLIFMVGWFLCRIARPHVVERMLV